MPRALSPERDSETRAAMGALFSKSLGAREADAGAAPPSVPRLRCDQACSRSG